MMNHLRESANGIFAKTLLGLLVLSFGVWGIGDIFRQGGGASSVTKVGHTSISVQEYTVALHNKQEQLRQMLGNAYKPDGLKKLQEQQQVLTSLISNLLVEKETASLGITVSDDDVISDIQHNPNFQGPDKLFDKSLYLTILRSNGMAEQRYVSDLRKDLAAKLISGTLIAGIIVPDDLVLAAYRAREEQREASLLLIPASAVKNAPAPTAQEITSYYEAYGKTFSTPEYRTLSYTELKLADVQAHMEVPEADIKQAYEDRGEEFRKPGSRVVEQMLFEKKEDAQKAAAELATGKSFADVAKSAALLNKDKLSLGDVTKKDLPSEAAADVFALKEGQSTAKPVQSGFGWHLFHVSKISPESVVTLAEARPGLVKDLAAKTSQETLYKLVSNLEDALAGGATLEAAAEKIGQKVHTFGPVTREGVAPDGSKPKLPPYDNLMSVAFATAEKDHSQATQSNDGSYFLVQVDKLTPERIPPLAEVKERILAALMAEKKRSLLASMAEDIATQLRSGKKPGAVLAGHGIAADTVASGRLKRGSEAGQGGKTLPRQMVSELFQLAKPGDTTRAYKLASGDAMIATLTDVTAAPAITANAKILQPIRDELKGTLTNEILTDYLTYLRNKYGVSINETALHSRDEESGE